MNWSRYFDSAFAALIVLLGTVVIACLVIGIILGFIFLVIEHPYVALGLIIMGAWWYLTAEIYKDSEL